MSADILGTSCDQCRSKVQYCFTSTETIRLVRTENPERPPRLSHSTWTMHCCCWSLLYGAILHSRADPLSSSRRGTGGDWDLRTCGKKSGTVPSAKLSLTEWLPLYDGQRCTDILMRHSLWGSTVAIRHPWYEPQLLKRKESRKTESNRCLSAYQD